jgi:hypothetical protein
VLCSKQSVDRETNAISLFEVIEAVQFYTKEIPTFPLVVPFSASLVSLWTRSTPDESVKAFGKVRLLSPKGEELMSQGFEIELETHSRSRTVLQLQGVIVGGPGIHEWEISSRTSETEKWERQTSIPMEVEIRKGPPK